MQPTGSDFMRLTRNENLSVSAQRQGVPIPPLELPYPPDAALIRLKEASQLVVPPLDVAAAIAQRATLREYSATPLTLDELAFLLWST